jgi:hypothetical protein
LYIKIGRKWSHKNKNKTGEPPTAGGEFIITVRNCVRDPSTDRPVIDCDIIAPPPPETEVAEGICGVRQGSGSTDRAAATASDDDYGGDTNSGDGGEGQGEDDGEEQEGGN